MEKIDFFTVKLPYQYQLSAFQTFKLFNSFPSFPQLSQIKMSRIPTKSYMDTFYGTDDVYIYFGNMMCERPDLIPILQPLFVAYVKVVKMTRDSDYGKVATKQMFDEVFSDKIEKLWSDLEKACKDWPEASNKPGVMRYMYITAIRYISTEAHQNV